MIIVRYRDRTDIYLHTNIYPYTYCYKVLTDLQDKLLEFHINHFI